MVRRVGPEGPRAASWSGWRLDIGVGLGCLAVLTVALRGFFHDPQSPWWTVPVLAVVAFQSGILAVLRRSEPWAFVATLCVDLGVSLALWDMELGRETGWWVWALQINLLSTAVSTLIWLAAGRQLYGDEIPGWRESPLLSLQVFLGLAGNVILLFNQALLAIVAAPGELPDSVAQAGNFWGWLAFGLTALVTILHWRVTRLPAGVHVVASLGMAAGVLAACTVKGWEWDNGNWLTYHVLTQSWLLVGAVMLLLGWIESRYRAWAMRGDIPLGRPIISPNVAQSWVSMAGVPVLALALRGVWSDPGGAWWSAGAIIGLGLLFACLALWQARQGWALGAGLALNLAFTLVLCRQQAEYPLAHWWLQLIQANVIGFALSSLVWLLVGRWARQPGQTDLSAAPLLTVQIGLALVGNLVLLIGPACFLLADPGHLFLVVQHSGNPLGWLALVLSLIAALWRAETLLTRANLNILVLLALAVGVLAACSAAWWDQGDWLAYHVLTLGWGLTGMALLGIGWLVSRPARLSDGPPPPPRWSATLVQSWAAVLGVLVLLLVARGVLVGPAAPGSIRLARGGLREACSSSP